MAETNVLDSWIPTHTGKRVSLTDPQPDQICIEDIAAGLSKVCRWSGQTPLHYSVAQHCVMCAGQFARRDLSLAALLHDASEAYLGDVSRPLKWLLPGYREIESRMEEVIAGVFDIPYPWPSIIKDVDNGMAATESQAFGWDAVWQDGPPPYRMGLEIWDAEWARSRFLDVFHAAYEPKAALV